MGYRKVGGTVLATLATGAVVLAVVKVVEQKRMGIESTPDDLTWIRELRDQLRAAEKDDLSEKSAVLARAYRDLVTADNAISSRKLRRQLNKLLTHDPSLTDEILIGVESLLGRLEEAVERRTAGKRSGN
jgi:hypothetical protein